MDFDEYTPNRSFMLGVLLGAAIWTLGALWWWVA